MEKTPLFIGLRAARVNLVPGLIIQAVLVVLVLAYYFHPPVRAVLESLAAAKERGGFFFTMISTAIAGAILPETLKVLTFQRGKVRRENLDELLFLLVFWSLDGVIVDMFYRLQALWFGSEINLSTIVKKVLVDQFLYNPFFAAPLGLFFYEWKNQHYARAGMSRTFTWTFYKNKTIPTLFATWTVWIPLTAAIYALPQLLQIPIFCLALTFWVMMFAYITSSARGRAVLTHVPTATQEA